MQAKSTCPRCKCQWAWTSHQIERTPDGGRRPSRAPDCPGCGYDVTGTNERAPRNFHYYAKTNDVAGMQQLLDQGEDVNASVEGQGFHPLVVAAIYGSGQAAEFLLDYGADRAQIPLALVKANEFGHAGVLRLLEERSKDNAEAAPSRQPAAPPPRAPVSRPSVERVQRPPRVAERCAPAAQPSVTPALPQTSKPSTPDDIPPLWIVWSFFPFINWIAWIHASLRARRPGYLLFAAGYFLLILPWFIWYPGSSDDRVKEEFMKSAMGKTALSLVLLGWLGGICHSLWARKKINLRIKYAAMITIKEDAELEKKIADEYDAKRPTRRRPSS